jgi:tetratricopeptide (TPR) repeat protein
VIAALLFILLSAAGQQERHPVAPTLARYRALVETYRSGHARDAILGLETLTSKELRGAAEAARVGSHTAPSAQGVRERFFRTAAMLHTDTAEHLWPSRRREALVHIELARGWADVAGSPFRSRWHQAAGLLLVERGIEQGSVNAALEHFERACRDLPADAPLLIASAWLDERAALAVGTWEKFPNKSAVSRAVREKGIYLASAVRRLSAALRIDPSATEAALRLGHVLMLLGDTAQAQSVLSDVVNRTGITADHAYLARLFLGRVREQVDDAAGADVLYRDASTRIPSGQSARMAIADQLYNSGDARHAADAIEDIVTADPDRRVDDPWIVYLIGHLPRGLALRDELRAEARQ